MSLQVQREVITPGKAARTLSALERSVARVLHHEWVSSDTRHTFRKCRVSSSDRAKRQLHACHEQTYGFSPVCVRKCALRWLDLVYRLLHASKPHTNTLRGRFAADTSAVVGLGSAGGELLRHRRTICRFFNGTVSSGRRADVADDRCCGASVWDELGWSPMTSSVRGSGADRICIMLVVAGSGTHAGTDVSTRSRAAVAMRGRDVNSESSRALVEDDDMALPKPLDGLGDMQLIATAVT